MFTIASSFSSLMRIRFRSGAELIFTWYTWTERLQILAQLVVYLAVFKVINMTLVAIKRRFERKLQEENARITRMALLIQTEMKIRRQEGVKIREQRLLDLKQQKQLWRTVIVEKRVELLSRTDPRRRSRAFFPDY